MTLLPDHNQAEEPIMKRLYTEGKWRLIMLLVGTDERDSVRKPPGRKTLLSSATLATLVVALALPTLAVAAGASNDPGSGLSTWLGNTATELYAGVVAIMAVVLLLKREIKALAVFVFAALLVGWLVFDPSSVGQSGKSIATKIFG